jgi:hypothetical protein
MFLLCKVSFNSKKGLVANKLTDARLPVFLSAEARMFNKLCHKPALIFILYQLIS